MIDYSRTVNRYTELDAYPLPRNDDMVNNISKYKYFATYDLKTAYHQIKIPVEDREYTAFEGDGRLWQFTRVPNGVTNGVSAFQRIMDNVIDIEGLAATFAFLDNITIAGETPEELEENKRKWEAIAEKYNLQFNHAKTVEFCTKLAVLGYIIEHLSVQPDPERLKPLMDLPSPMDLPSLRRITGMFSYYSKWIRNYSKKIRPLIRNTTFPLPTEVEQTFQDLKKEIASAALTSPDPNVPFVVETDASDYAIGATLNQNGRPVAFFSRTLNPSECGLHPVEKEAYAIVESLETWKHFLIGQYFKLITDQRSVSFMFDQKNHGKIKNDKIARWRLRLSNFKFDVVYRPGKENHAADALSRIRITSCSAIVNNDSKLKDIHDSLCHPGVTRTNHFVRTRNLPFSVADIRKMIESCRVCQELKPRFHKSSGVLIKATQPLQQLNIDFKGPLPTPSSSSNRYILTLVDEYSRFPFAFPCKDMTSATVIKCFNQLFALFGMPSYIHNDRAPDFLSKEVKDYLHSKGIATSKTSRYNPRGNGQAERYNGTIWKAVTLALKSKDLPLSAWEHVLPDALHSIRSLLCTATNCTPHERMFNFQRKSTAGNAVPSWLAQPGPVYVRKHVRNSKYDPIVEEAELIEANPEYAFIRLNTGHETTVSLRDLAPCGDHTAQPEPEDNVDVVSDTPTVDHNSVQEEVIEDAEVTEDAGWKVVGPRRSAREKKQVERFADSEHSKL